MKSLKRVSSAVLSMVIASTVVTSTEVFAEEGFSAVQKVELGKIVHDYIVNNPGVLVEASAALQKQQHDKLQATAKSAIIKFAEKLLIAGETVAGNPKGKVTVIEFFDYQCGHCKHMSPIVADLVKADPNVRVIYKEFPIFGPSSDMASKAALAAAKQGKYLAMQKFLFSLDKPVTEEIILGQAKTMGLNIEMFKADMKSTAIHDVLKQNRSLAENMSLMGTPAFIIIATPDGHFSNKNEPILIPGAASLDALKSAVKNVSA